MASRRYGIPVFCILFFMGLAGGTGIAQDGARVVFLHLKLSHGTLTLLSQAVRSGSVKPSRGAQQYAAWTYDLLSSSGEVLWSGAMHDPSLKRYEYEDPARPGTLKSKQVLLDEVEFSVKVPDITGGSRLQFYRSIAPSAGAEGPVRRLIGSIPLGAGGVQR